MDKTLFSKQTSTHDIIKKQRQFLMIDPGFYPVLNYNTLENKFSNWN